MGGGIANINLGPVSGTFNGGALTIAFSQISRNTALGQGGGIFEATITSSGPAAGGPPTTKFSQVTRNKAAVGGGGLVVPGSPVTLKVTVVAKNIPDNCAPPGTIAGCKNPAPSRAARTEYPLPARNRRTPARFRAGSIFLKHKTCHRDGGAACCA